MQRCTVCNGRTIMVGDRYKCMKSACEGSQLSEESTEMKCRCGETMSYQGEDSWGQPNYTCIYCGASKRIER
ncbi:MAG: hypothetical protein AAGI66_00795 [Cyanobacteria bacterium P01_H01_bin.74]